MLIVRRAPRAARSRVASQRELEATRSGAMTGHIEELLEQTMKATLMICAAAASFVSSLARKDELDPCAG